MARNAQHPANDLAPGACAHSQRLAAMTTDVLQGEDVAGALNEETGKGDAQ